MNADRILKELYEPLARQELNRAAQYIARSEGFSSVEEWHAHHKAEARRPINRLRRAKRRIQGRIVRAANNRWGSGWE